MKGRGGGGGGEMIMYHKTEIFKVKPHEARRRCSKEPVQTAAEHCDLCHVCSV